VRHELKTSGRDGVEGFRKYVTRHGYPCWSRTFGSTESLVIQALRQALAQPDEVLAERERTAVIETIDELMGMESDRHPMFSEGYDYALDHIKQFVRGRDRRDKEEKNT
jgi:hypothetical protein